MPNVSVTLSDEGAVLLSLACFDYHTQSFATNYHYSH